VVGRPTTTSRAPALDPCGLPVRVVDDDEGRPAAALTPPLVVVVEPAVPLLELLDVRDTAAAAATRAAATVAGGAMGDGLDVAPDDAILVRLPFVELAPPNAGFFSFDIGRGEPMRYLWLDARVAKGDRTCDGGARRE
jgi:hypothetical protein